jgi:hypothetical protein
MHHSYRAKKSFLDTTAGISISGVGNAILKYATSQTMLAQDGAAQESKGSAGGVGWCCWVSTTLASLPSTPIEGEAGRHEEGLACVVPASRYLPSTL